MMLLDFERKLVWVTGLMIRCPMGTALPNCPLASVRELPVEDRIKLTDEMDEARLDEIIEYHEACLRVREGLAQA